MEPQAADAIIDDFLGAHYRLSIIERADGSAIDANVARFIKMIGTDAAIAAQAKVRLQELSDLESRMPEPSQLKRRCFISSVHIDFLRRTVGA